MNYRLPLLAISGVAMSFLLAACGSSSSPASTAGSTTPTPTTPVATGTAVQVTETEFKIEPATSSLKAGTYTFTVKNTGSITHALNVDGPGVQDASTGNIQSGASGTVTVKLRAGKYDLYCPVGNHKMQGMDHTVTVS